VNGYDATTAEHHGITVADHALDPSVTPHVVVPVGLNFFLKKVAEPNVRALQNSQRSKMQIQERNFMHQNSLAATRLAMHSSIGSD
jgi:hypothetical protein